MDVLAYRFLLKLGAGRWLIAYRHLVAPGELCWQAVVIFSSPALECLPTLKPQEIPLDHPDSNNMFRPGPDKPLVATANAAEMYTNEVIIACWRLLREMADKHHGLDYLQVFESDEHDENLWYIEDGPGGAITALLPSDCASCHDAVDTFSRKEK